MSDPRPLEVLRAYLDKQHHPRDCFGGSCVCGLGPARELMVSTRYRAVFYDEVVSGTAAEVVKASRLGGITDVDELDIHAVVPVGSDERVFLQRLLDESWADANRSTRIYKLQAEVQAKRQAYTTLVSELTPAASGARLDEIAKLERELAELRSP